jgi:hypothetical protein
MKLFLLKNSKTIQHLVTLVIMAVAIHFAGLTKDVINSFPLQVFLFGTCFLISKYTTSKVNFDKELKEELKRKENKKG